MQEQRFRVLEDTGRGFLFILAHDASENAAQLHGFRDARVRVVVEYEGESGLASAIAHAVKAVE